MGMTYNRSLLRAKFLMGTEIQKTLQLNFSKHILESRLVTESAWLYD